MWELLIYSATSAFNMTPLRIFELYILTSTVCDVCGVWLGSQGYLWRAKMGCRGILSDGGVGIPCRTRLYIYSLHLIRLTDPYMIGNDNFFSLALKRKPTMPCNSICLLSRSSTTTRPYKSVSA